MINVRKARTIDTNDIHLLIGNIIEQLGNDKIESIGIDYIRDIIMSLGFVVVAYDSDLDNKIVGTTIVLYPAVGDKTNIGRTIGLKLPWQLNKVTDILIVAALPEYNEDELYGRMLQYCENITERPKYIMSAVLNKNEHLISAFEARGFSIEGSRIDDEGRSQAIMCKKRA